jgi:rhodanese-related sulfurtransferase
VPTQITPAELHRRRQAGERFLLLDVRQPWEHQLARIEGSVLIPLHELPEVHAELKLAEGERLVTYCHHGVRSYNAAAFLEEAGHGEVLNLAGGIAAWTRSVDPSVPEY